jgi:hypothetical protein
MAATDPSPIEQVQRESALAGRTAETAEVDEWLQRAGSNKPYFPPFLSILDAISANRIRPVIH